MNRSVCLVFLTWSASLVIGLSNGFGSGLAVFLVFTLLNAALEEI